MARQPTLTTDRLVLRPFDDDDVSRVTELASAKAVADTTLHIPHPYEADSAREWIAGHKERYDADKEVVFAVTLTEKAQLIGAIGLARAIVNPHMAELGYWIGCPYWGSGYCTEAASAVVSFGFKKWALDRVFAHHMTRNPASGRVMKKLGMKQEGLLRQHVLKWDQYEDVAIYGVLKSEFLVD